jgi:ATP-dependent Lhr-like helicase
VILEDGELRAYVGRTERNLLTFLPAAEPARGRAAAALARALARLVDDGGRRALLVRAVDGEDPASSPLGPLLEAEGFRPGSAGYLKRGSGRLPR